MNPLILICGIIAAIAGTVLLLDVRTPEVPIAIGLIAAGAGLIAVGAAR